MVYWNIRSFCSFFWLFIFVVFTALAKILLPKEILTSKRVNIFIINKRKKQMTSLLIIIVLVLLAVLWQLTKIFDPTRRFWNQFVVRLKAFLFHYNNVGGIMELNSCG
jgi:SNF family Na+-dependent transporter